MINMESGFSIVFILFGLSFLIGAQGNTCHQGWYYYEGSCYGFGELNVTWADAQEMCEVYNARLAEIETAQENTFLKNLARNKLAGEVWLGGADIFSEGFWEWLSNSVPIVEFTDWAKGEPNEIDHIKGEDCLELNPAQDYQWNDRNCDIRSFFICEAEPIESIVG